MKDFGYLVAILATLVAFWFIREKQCEYANMRFSLIVGQCIAEGVK